MSLAALVDGAILRQQIEVRQIEVRQIEAIQVFAFLRASRLTGEARTLLVSSQEPNRNLLKDGRSAERLMYCRVARRQGQYRK